MLDLGLYKITYDLSIGEFFLNSPTASERECLKMFFRNLGINMIPKVCYSEICQNLYLIDTGCNHNISLSMNTIDMVAIVLDIKEIEIAKK